MSSDPSIASGSGARAGGPPAANFAQERARAAALPGTGAASSGGSPGALSGVVGPSFAIVVGRAGGLSPGLTTVLQQALTSLRHASIATSGRAGAIAPGGPVGPDELDATARHTAHLQAHGGHVPVPSPGAAPSPSVVPGVPAGSAPASPTAATAASRASLEELLPALVRKIAWSGDERRGAVRIEVGAGPLAGATLLVQAQGGRVEVTLSAAAADTGDVDVEAWRDRIARRLEARGLQVDEVRVG